jgi:hypothetical protein
MLRQPINDLGNLQFTDNNRCNDVKVPNYRKKKKKTPH